MTNFLYKYIYRVGNRNCLLYCSRGGKVTMSRCDGVGCTAYLMVSKDIFERLYLLNFSIPHSLIKVPYKCSRHRVKQIKIIALGLFFSRVYYKTFRRIFQNGARHRGVWLTAAGLVSSLKPRFFPPGRAPSGLKMLPSLQSRVECSFSYYIHISTLYFNRHI